MGGARPRGIWGCLGFWSGGFFHARTPRFACVGWRGLSKPTRDRGGLIHGKRVLSMRLVEGTVFVAKPAALALVGVLTLLGLSACDQNMSQGPVALKRTGEELVVAVCEDIGAKSVLIETWAGGNGTPTATVLDAAGAITFQTGSVFSTRASLEGLTVIDRNPPAMDPRDNFAVQILSTSSSADDINATFTVGENGLSESLWLHPDGRETAEPCR